MVNINGRKKVNTTKYTKTYFKTCVYFNNFPSNCSIIKLLDTIAAYSQIRKKIGFFKAIIILLSIIFLVFAKYLKRIKSIILIIFDKKYEKNIIKVLCC